MDISGPLATSPGNAPRSLELSLRPFQRVTAHVLEVTGTTAILNIEGYPVVAQLNSADQAAELLTQQTAHFIVSQISSQKITLKLDKKDENASLLTGHISTGPELAVRLLEQQNIPVTVNHLMVARALLKKHLPVTAEAVAELAGVLSGVSSWGVKEADLAAALKAAGLPVNAETLKLASRETEKIGNSSARLIAMLTEIAGQDLPPDLLAQLDSSRNMLNAVVLDEEAETSRLTEQFKAWVDALGISPERVLLELSRNADPSAGEKNLLALIRLQQALDRAGKNEAARALNEFLTDLRLSHFLNARPDQWLDVSFPFRIEGINDREISSARLRIARDPQAGTAKINPAYTRLILQVELEPGETVEVDLSVVDKQVRTSVTAIDPAWCEQAERELPTLTAALEELGFNLNDSQFHVGKPQTIDTLKVASDRIPPMTVDIEV